MVASEEFIKYCVKTLEVNFGQLSNEIIKKINNKKSLNDNSNANDFKEYIDLIELNVSVFSGKHKASDICSVLRTRATEMTGAQTPKPAVVSVSGDIDREINTFLSNNSLPSEADIMDYSKLLTIKFGGNAKSVEKELIDKVKLHVKAGIGRQMLKVEIHKFLARFQQPEKADIIDFVNYIRLSRIIYPETQLKEDIENERILRKFNRIQELVEPSLIDQFMSFIKENRDREVIKKYMEKEGNIYLIKEGESVSETLLSELIDLMVISENEVKDVLAQMGLQHMIENK